MSVSNHLKLPADVLVFYLTAVDSAQEALTDMPPRAEEVSQNEILFTNLSNTFNHFKCSKMFEIMLL